MARSYDLLVRARGNTSDAERSLKQLQRSMRNAGRQMQSVGRNLTMGLTAPIVAFAGLGVKEALETRTAMMKVDAVLKSMGSTAKVSRTSIMQIADELERYSAIEGDLILNAESVGMTFKALAGNPQLFKDTMKAAIDMSGALGQDLQTSVIQLGKAMQNGAKGAGALSRNGTLAKDDIAKLQDMAKKGYPMWKQQAFILEAVNKQYAGQGRNVDPMKRMMVVLKQTAETFGTMLLPAIESVGKWMERVNRYVQEMSPRTRRLAGIAMLLAAALGPVLIVVGSLVSGLSALLPVIVAIGPEVAAVAAVVGVVAAAFTAWYRRNEDFRESVKTIGRALFEHKLLIASILLPVVGVTAAMVKLYRRSELFRDIIRAVGTAIGWTVTKIAQIIAAAISFAERVAGAVKGSNTLKTAFAALKSIADGVADKVAQAASALVSIAGTAGRAASALGGALRNALTWLKRSASGALTGLQSALGSIATAAQSAASWIQKIIDKLDSALSKLGKLRGLLPNIPGMSRASIPGTKSMPSVSASAAVPEAASAVATSVVVNQYFMGEPSMFAAAQSAKFQFATAGMA